MRACVIAAILFGLLPIPASADDAALAETKRQTFVVQSCPGTGKAIIGSGVVVARDRGILTIATAAHAIVPGDTLRILDVSRRAYYDVVGIKVLSEYDLALVRVRAQVHFSVAPVPIAKAAPDEPVWLWGHPPDTFWVVAKGSVIDAQAQIPGRSGSPRITIACESCAHGDSGAGVFDALGRLLGILTHKWSNAEGTIAFYELAPATIITQELKAPVSYFAP